MPDNQGFSATNFIKKQYKKSSSPDSENDSANQDNNSQNSQNSAEPAVANEKKTAPAKSKESLSPEAIRTIVKQNLDMAKKQLDTGRIWEAIGLYKANLQLQPQDLVTNQQLADALIKVNARTDAVDTLSRLAGILERDGKLEKANEIYEKIYGLDPNNELACSVLGRKSDHKIPYPDLPFSQSESEESVSASKTLTMDKINQENTNISQDEPPEIQEAFPIPDESVKKPVQPVKPVSEDDIPTVIQKVGAKQVDQEGPKPVEELVPMDQIPSKPAESKKIPVSKIDSSPKPKPPPLEPKPVDELIPFPPMPEKKEEKTPSSGISKPVEMPKRDIDLPKVEEAFPIPLPEMEEIPEPVIETARPVKQISGSQPSPVSSPSESKSETVKKEETPVPESPTDRIQYYLDKMAMDPENIDYRLKYISAFLEIGLEQELVDDYLELANCYRNKGMSKEAIRYYQKVLDLDPSLSEAEKRMSMLKGEADQQTKESGPELSKADSGQVEQFKRLLVLNPLNEPIARKLANFYRSKNMHKEAVEELNILADAYMQRGLYNKAEPIYAELVKEAPSDELKQKLAKSRSLKKSMDAINQAIKTYKTDLKVPTRKIP